jgi:hypothetical protein
MDLVAALGRLDLAEYCSALWAHMVDAARRAWFGSDFRELQSLPAGASDRSSSDLVLALPSESQHAGAVLHLYAMAVRSGCLSSWEAVQLFTRTQAGDSGQPMTYWYRTMDLEAAMAVGQIQWGLDSLRRHWGSVLEAGMTTLWEIFDPSWLGQDPHGMSIVTSESATYGGYRTSHCHGGAAGPAAWLHRAVLGVSPVRDGFAAIRFAPALGDLEWAEGTVPTPRGPIQVSLRRRPEGQPKAEITLPQDIELRMREDVPRTWEIEERRVPGGERGTCC